MKKISINRDRVSPGTDPMRGKKKKKNKQRCKGMYVVCYIFLSLKKEKNFRLSGLGWVVILKGSDGKEYVPEHVDLSVDHSEVVRGTG